MKLISARITDNLRILPPLERKSARSLLGGHLLRLECPEIAAEAVPGQYVMVHCGAECTLARPFGIHTVNRELVSLFFSVLEDGKGTQWLSGRQPGDIISLYGPLGNGFTIDPDAFNLLLIAGGNGIAPIRYLAEEALRGGRTVTLLMGAFTGRQLYHERLLPTGITELVTATEDGSAGKKGLITSLLPEFVGKADQVFACGPMPMYRDMVTRYGKLLKNKSVQVSLEVRMGCGLGICYSCTVKTKSGLKQVCKDGPVFELNDILWENDGLSF